MKLFPFDRGVATLCLSVIWLMFGTPPATAQSENNEICPSSTALYMKVAGQSKASVGQATLLWLDRGDAMWSDHPLDAKSLSRVTFPIIYSYKTGQDGYPKDKKTAKRLDKYKQAHRAARPPVIGGSGDVFPRPKGVPVGPPASAIAAAEAALNCRYDAEASSNITTARRTEMTKSRTACPVDWHRFIRNLSPSEDRERDTNSWLRKRQNKALAVLDWKLRGSDAFHLPAKNGTDRFRQTKNEILNFLRSGENTLVSPDPERFAALQAFSSNGPIAASLESPSDEMFYWAEDFLNCRYDPVAWEPIEAALDAKAQRYNAAEAYRKASAKSERETLLKSRGWLVPNTNKFEPVGGVEETSNRDRYRGFNPEICDGYYGGLKEKPALTAFEREWGNWFTHHREYGTRCRYRPVERYFTTAERKTMANNEQLKRRQDQIAEEQKRYRKKYGDNPKSLGDMINDHVDRETEKSKVRDEYKECVRKYGDGNCVIVD